MCPVQDARPDAPGSTSGCESPPSVSKGLLLVRYPANLPPSATNYLGEVADKVAMDLGLRGMMVPDSIEVQVQQDLSPLIEAIQAQTEAITKLAMVTAACVDALAAQAGEEEADPDVEIPQSLSARR